MSTRGEISVIGLGRSGRAAAELLAGRGATVYASDAGINDDLAESAKGLQRLGVEVELGGHDLERIRRSHLVVVSPGVAPHAAPLTAARAADVPVLSEVSIGLDALPHARVIAVTGTNGKSTTTAIVAHLLAALGCRAAAAGNIGRAVSELALEVDPPDWIALEISSFQLHDTPRLSPAVGVLTNLAPDHLDRYRTIHDYHADKRLLFTAASANSQWVTNADDAAVQAMSAGVPGTHHRFSLRGTGEAHLDSVGSALVLFERRLCGRHEFPLLGLHNVANALAASLAVAVADERHRTEAGLAAIGHALVSFTGLPHRLELVAEIDGVQWINDSKATNVESARVAVEAMSRPTILLLGGRHKGEPYSVLAEPIRRHARHVVAYGEAGPVIVADLRAENVAAESLGDDFAVVVERARALSRSGDAVLLAPACSSFDMFRDYGERGAVFRRMVQANERS